MGRVVQKYWLTGVLPAFRDGISPLSATNVISMLPQYNDLCSLTEDEVRTIAKAYLGSTHPDVEQQEIKRWYNGYRFCHHDKKLPTLYNRQLVFTHLRALLTGGELTCPSEEANVTHSATVLDAIRNANETSLQDVFLSAASGRL